VGSLYREERGSLRAVVFAFDSERSAHPAWRGARFLLG